MYISSTRLINQPTRLIQALLRGTTVNFIKNQDRTMLAGIALAAAFPVIALIGIIAEAFTGDKQMTTTLLEAGFWFGVAGMVLANISEYRRLKQKATAEKNHPTIAI